MLIDPMRFAHLNVTFFTDAVHNVRKSAEEDRPVYDDVDFVRITIAGDPKNIIVARADDPSGVVDERNRRLPYKEVHKAAYDAFKAGQSYKGEGTPLAQLPTLSPARREELLRSEIYTIEQLASLEGDRLARLGMGARTLKDLAVDWVSRRAKSADVTRLSAENEELRERLARLEAASNDRLGRAMNEAVEKQKGHKVDLVEAAYPSEPSPFQPWADEDIVNWIVDNGGEKPHHNCSHATLVGKADDLNAEIASRNKARAA
jgi:hypothetical protein